MIILFGLDDDFAMPGGVAIASVDRFLSAGDQVVVLHHGITPDNIDALCRCARNVDVRVIDCSGLLDSSWVSSLESISDATYLRFLAAELLDGEDSCLYLDGDVIVRRDPSPVFDTNLAGVTLGVVQSRVAPFLASPGGVVHWFELGLPSTSPNFNAGVLLMNLGRWRDHHVTNRLTEYLRTYGEEIRHGDQEAMNAVLHDELVLLDRTWNYITHVTESFLQHPENEPTNPHVVHFAGRRKPWAHGAKPIFAEEWYQLLEQTPWRGWRPSPPPTPTGPKARMVNLARRGASHVRSFLREPS